MMKTTTPSFFHKNFEANAVLTFNYTSQKKKKRKKSKIKTFFGDSQPRYVLGMLLKF